jgi:hypothetical protein
MARWSMKKDRELIQLVRAHISVNRIAARLETSPLRVMKIAKRLGFCLPPIAPKQGGKATP